MTGHTCGYVLELLKSTEVCLAPIDNPLVNLKVAVVKKDLEKELLNMCQGNLDLPSGFHVTRTKRIGRRKYLLTLKYADVAQ